MASIKRYRLFILCNVSSIAVLYCFLSIVENKQFMNQNLVDSMISSNIIMPTLLLIIFIALFIPYTQNAFIKARQKDYGILLTLGMTENEVRNSVLIESVILYLVFLFSGLITGTALSVFFLGFIRYVLKINYIDISISFSAYGLTALCVTVIFVFALAVNIIKLITSTIYEKLKNTDKTESRNRSNIVLFILGLVITIISLVFLAVYYRVNENLFIICWGACIIGSAFVFFNGESVITLIQNKRYKKYIQNIFVWSDIKYYYGKNKTIFLANTWLLFIIFFFVTYALVSHTQFRNNAMIYHPFDMVYAETDNFFTALDNAEIESIVESKNNNITQSKNVKFVRNNALTVFCVDDINRLLNKDYHISSSSVIYVYGYDVNDGYNRQFNLDIPNFSISTANENKTFTIQDVIIAPLFGQINAISNNMLLVSKQDFDWLSAHSNNFNIHGILHILNFENWSGSLEIVNEVWDRLLNLNNIDKYDFENNRFYKISSKAEAVDTALKSSNLLIFVFLFLSFLLYLSSIIMIHFKLKSEQENDKKKFRSLYRIGIQDKEVKNIINKKILVIFFVSPVYTFLISFIFSQSIYNQYGFGQIGIVYTAVMSCVFFLVHFLLFKLYADNCNKDIVS